jgi:deazaflavin-dependent oxidoreductase (nitroreductase family)
VTEPTPSAVEPSGPEGCFGRVMSKVSGTKLFAKIAPPIVTNADRLVYKLTKGRRVLTSTGSVLPMMMLTTTGAKSGEARRVPLATIPDGEVFYLVGSNFGREHHPAWTGNLMKTPRATVTFEEDTFPVTATLLDADEKAEVWPKLLALWPNYDGYQERSGRDIRVFRLERTT